MGESGTSVLNLSESALNSLKKCVLVQKMLDLKGKFIVDTGLHKLSNQIYKFAEVIDQISLENRKLKSELDTRLEERIMNLEKIKQKGSSIAKGS